MVLGRITRRIFRSTPPISKDGPSGTILTHRVDISNLLPPVRRVSSFKFNKRTSYVPCLQLLLTVWTADVTVNILPDDLLLRTFHFVRVTHLHGLEDDRVISLDGLEDVEPVWRLPWWYQLIHVCQKWRSVVFAAPTFLDLRLVCGPRTRVELTSIWPPFPIIIRSMVDWPMPEDYDFNAAIVRNDRVSVISLFQPTSSQLQRLSSAMQEQFPELMHLALYFNGNNIRRAPALPNGFLGGSAPRLQYLMLHSIPFPALPTLLLSATHLVHLTLQRIPHSGYFSPKVIVTSLAVSTNLKSLTIEFESPLSRPSHESRHPPPLTRIVFPALTHFQFKGVSEYIEDLVAQIDAPSLDSIWITFFHQLLFDIPQLAQFVRRTTRFQEPNEVHVDFDQHGVNVNSLPSTWTKGGKSGLRISCRELERQLSSLAQVFTSLFPSIHMVKYLYIYGPQYSPLQWRDDINNMQWVDFFHPFATLKNLYLSNVVALGIAPTLRELGRDGMTGVLPILQKIFLEPWPSRPVTEAIGHLSAARHHRVTVSRWNGKRSALLGQFS